ncbi:MAG: hypothetical protein OFPI_15210 [Osedax symbiont Rs2]|nr:MAG: hypothetical protein OFPII_40610 [Osedax symbiont Rs1]EPJ52152.1 MAG: hypothetical protein OFPI_15210 [Osedax symbiont Rs2]
MRTFVGLTIESDIIERLVMSTCCGGCGGQDTDKPKAEEKPTEQQPDKPKKEKS